MSDVASNLGAAILARRRAAGMSQRKLAAECGQTQDQVYMFESRGRVPTIATAAAIAAAFGIKLSTLIRDAEKLAAAAAAPPPGDTPPE